MNIFRMVLPMLAWVLVGSLGLPGMHSTCTAAEVKGTLQVSGVLDIVENGKVDWSNGQIRAFGVGVAPENEHGVKARLLAREAAVVLAERNLAKIVHGIHVSSETTVRNLTIDSDIVRTRVEGFIKGAVILREKELPDGAYEVVMALDLYGDNRSLSQSIGLPAQFERVLELPIVVDKNPDADEREPVKDPGNVDPSFEQPTGTSPETNVRPEGLQDYTGLIIDCRGLPLARTMCPRLFDQDDRNLWKQVDVPDDVVLEKGLAAYYHSLDDAMKMGRVGKNPLVVKAVCAVGGKFFKSDIVVSSMDGNIILAENERSHFLNALAVGILVD